MVQIERNARDLPEHHRLELDKLNFGLYTCGEAFPDLGEVTDHVERAFAELADAAQQQAGDAAG